MTEAAPIRTVLFGLGKMGRFHYKALQQDTNFELLAVVDPVVGELPDSAGDFTCDGRVDSADLNEVGLNWQFGVPAGARVPRAPLAAGAPAAPTPVADVAIVDVVSSDFGKTPERESIAITYGTTRGRDFADSLPRWRSKAHRSEHVARRSERTGESQTIQQIADEIFGSHKGGDLWLADS